MIASVPGVAALLSAPRLGKTWRSNRTRKDPDYSADLFCTAVDPNVLRSDGHLQQDFTFCSVPPMVHYSRRTDTVGLQLEQPDRRAYLQL